MIKEQIKGLIVEALGQIGVDTKHLPVFTIEHPDDMKNGDWSTNVAMVLAKTDKGLHRIVKKVVSDGNASGVLDRGESMNPRQFADKLVEILNKNKPREIEKIEVAGPGFINFYLSNEYFSEQVEVILNNGDDYGNNNNLNRQKTIIEYTDPNPFKEFHIGHLMSNTIGESIARIIEANGALIKRANYQGDVGLHVAKTIWGTKKMLEDNPSNRKDFFGGFLGFGKNPRIWGQAYALGSTAYEGENESTNAKQEIVEINKKIYEKSDKEINYIYDIGRKISLREFEKMYKILGTKFDDYFFESEVGDPGKKIVLQGLARGIFEKSDGAIIFRGEKYDPTLHTRVLINSQDLPTYEAKELGLIFEKNKRFSFDKTISVTGNEINDYYLVMLKAMELVMPDLAQKAVHIGHGMLRLPTGKMSSRTGKVISGESLLAEIKNNILEKMKDREFTKKERKIIAEIVSVGALKYSILKQAMGGDIIFDFNKSLSFEGDSGPYLQYSYVRAKSILDKAKKEGIRPKIESKINFNIGELGKSLIRFPEMVERAGQEYAPHYLATYLTELASTFSTFYAQEVVVDKADINSPAKVALTQAFSIVMKNGLTLLGIEVPERM